MENFAQLKALFKDTWETIPGNCDTFIYLGGNEQNTHKYVSELLGKGTIDKKSSGETKGRQGSSSRNYDVLGRELFTPDEVRKLDNKKCIIFIRGFDPIMDNKFIPFNHPMFNQTADAHLVLDERATIEVRLRERVSFTEIGRELGKDPSTISKEVRLHSQTVRKDSFNPCSKRSTCDEYGTACSKCKLQYSKSRKRSVMMEMIMIKELTV